MGGGGGNTGHGTIYIYIYIYVYVYSEPIKSNMPIRKQSLMFRCL